MNRMSALIIDDEVGICSSLSGVLQDESWVTSTAQSGEEALQLLKTIDPKLIFLDIWMPTIDGIETLQRIKSLKPHIPVVIMSGHGTIETAVRVTRLGAMDFLEKPLSIDKVLPILEKIKDAESDESGSSRVKTELTEFLGETSAIQNIRRQIQVVATKNSWVLITGESGTGKEVVAKNIHLLSQRAQKNFVAVNCAAIPDDLIESELFGHKKGAFTNALQNKKGKFEIAHQGTLFLDEIADMSLKTQAKILRILQEQKFERVGGEESMVVDVRVIAATNKDLIQEISKGTFREDLYYRLNVIPFHLPPLRDRTEDLDLLANYFLNKFSKSLNEDAKTISTEAMEVLRLYSWPGNIREFKNLIERLCIMVQGREISLSNIKDALGELAFGGITKLESSISGVQRAGASLKAAKDEFEKQFILRKLEENQWNVSKTADAIGVERTHLHKFVSKSICSTTDIEQRCTHFHSVFPII